MFYSLVDKSAPSASVSCPAQTPSVHFADSGLPIYNFEAITGAAVSVEAPTAIRPGAAVSLTVKGATNPGPGRYTLSVFGSAAPTPAVSGPYTIGPASGLAPPTVALNTDGAGVPATAPPPPNNGPPSTRN